jgi:hypothetical protein
MKTTTIVLILACSIAFISTFPLDHQVGSVVLDTSAPLGVKSTATAKAKISVSQKLQALKKKLQPLNFKPYVLPLS